MNEREAKVTSVYTVEKKQNIAAMRKEKAKADFPLHSYSRPVLDLLCRFSFFPFGRVVRVSKGEPHPAETRAHFWP